MLGPHYVYDINQINNANTRNTIGRIEGKKVKLEAIQDRQFIITKVMNKPIKKAYFLIN